MSEQRSLKAAILSPLDSDQSDGFAPRTDRMLLTLRGLLLDEFKTAMHKFNPNEDQPIALLAEMLQRFNS